MPLINQRTRLRNFLKEQLTLHATSKSIQSAVLQALLQQAVGGLEALNYGEVQPMFAPGDKKGAKDGTKPYTLRKMRMEAIGFGDLLMANGYKGDDPAVRTVASAYGEKAATYRAWRKSDRLGKTRDPVMQSFRQKIAKLDWDETQILAALKEAGKTFILEKKRAHGGS